MGDDFFDVVPREGFDVCCGEFLKEKLITHAAGRFATTPFLRAKHGKVYLRPLQKLGHGTSHLHGAAIISGGAANPIKHIEAGVILYGGYIEALSPREPVLCGKAPRVASSLHFLQGSCRSTAQFAFSDEVAAQVGNIISRPDT